MLVVTDNGIQVLLKQTPMPKIILQNVLISITLLVINGILAFVVHLYSSGVSICIAVLIIVFTSILQDYHKRHQPKVLSGGDLLLSPKAFIHTFLGRTTQYQLTQYDTIETQGDSIKIRNAHSKVLYQITGFSEPKQLEVAQAVLQGKSIQTQGKAIKMQSN